MTHWYTKVLLGADPVVAKAEAEAEAAAIEKSAEERARIAEDARKFNADVQRRIRKAQEEKAKPRRSAAESLEEVKKIVNNIQRIEDSHALERLEKSGEQIRKQNPKLTKEQAFLAAMQENPEDVAGYMRHHARGWGYDGAESVRKSEDAKAVLDRAARPFMDADPSLTREQAIVKALEADPSLYERTAS